MPIERVLEMLPPVICAVVGVPLFARLTAGLRLLVVHAVIASCIEFAARIINPGANNHLVYTIFLPVDFILIHLAARNFLGRIFLPFILCASLLFFGVYFFILAGSGTEFLPFEAVVVSWILQAICWFLVLQRGMRYLSGPGSYGICLIAGGIMLFACTTTPVWAMFRYNMLHDPQLARNLQHIANITGMIRYLACGIGFILLADKHVPIARHAVR